MEAGDEVPLEIPERGIVLVGSADDPRWAVFDCPCKNGHRLMLNLDTSRSPAWRIQPTRRVSMSPSIDSYTEIGRCHFFVRRGKVQWV